MPKFREVKIRASVTLPSLNTDVPPREYDFLAFLHQWVVQAPGMRRDENLPHLFEWEETLDAFAGAVRDEKSIEEPRSPVINAEMKPDEIKKAVEGHQAAIAEARSKLVAAAVGRTVYVSDEAFVAAKISAKQALDAALTPDQLGNQPIHPTWGPKVLRHYHALIQSAVIEENDVPRAKAVTNGKVTVAAEV